MNVTPPAPPTPTTPQRLPWWQRTWAPFAIGITALIVGAGIGGSSGSTSKTISEISTTTVTGPTATVQVIKHATRTKTVTAAPQAAPAPTPPSNTGGGGKTYSGNGDKNFGTITVAQDSTLHWTCTCDPANGFYLSSSLNADGNDISIQQSGSSGTTAVSAGTYREVKSIGNGDFTFRITPG